MFSHLICSLVDNDASAAALLKGWMFLLVVVEACFLITPPREYPKEFRIGPIYAGGNPKGALPPLCRRGGGVHRGGTPSKGSLPYACFCLLFPRGKSRSGYGGETPGGRQIEWQQFGKRNVSLPPARRWANLGPSVPFAGTGEAKWGTGPEAPKKRRLRGQRRRLR